MEMMNWLELKIKQCQKSRSPTTGFLPVTGKLLEECKEDTGEQINSWIKEWGQLLLKEAPNKQGDFIRKIELLCLKITEDLLAQEMKSF